MNDLLSELESRILWITLNRVNKNNAFNDTLLAKLKSLLDEANRNPEVHVIVIKANGRHFSAGADLAWMKRMAEFSEEENLKDAKVLAEVMHTLHQSPKPTIAMVQGAAIGGGTGLVAACDMAIAANHAYFCFPEVKLGLIPAVISPYVIQAIGPRAAKHLFISAETFDAKRALELQLIHHCVPEKELLSYTLHYAQQIAQLPPMAIRASKSLVHQVTGQNINDELLQTTASLIAKARVSKEGQHGLQSFLNKKSNYSLRKPKSW